MVRNASGAFSKAAAPWRQKGLLAVLVRARVRVDPLLEDRRGFEDHHAPRRDRYFLAGLGIAADPLALLAHDEGSERGQLHRLAALKTIGDLLQHQFHEGCGLGAREADLLVDGFAKI